MATADANGREDRDIDGQHPQDELERAHPRCKNWLSPPASMLRGVWPLRSMFTTCAIAALEEDLRGSRYRWVAGALLALDVALSNSDSALLHEADPG